MDTLNYEKMVRNIAAAEHEWNILLNIAVNAENRTRIYLYIPFSYSD